MRKLTVALLVAMLAVSASVQAAKPILNIENRPISARTDGSVLSVEDVQQAIVSACNVRKWTPAIETDGVVMCSITVRGKHYAEVEIQFNSQDYSILYRSSENLDYNKKKQRIHRNYNNWVVNLSRAIDQFLAESS